MSCGAAALAGKQSSAPGLGAALVKDLSAAWRMELAMISSERPAFVMAITAALVIPPAADFEGAMEVTVSALRPASPRPESFRPAYSP